MTDAAAQWCVVTGPLRGPRFHPGPARAQTQWDPSGGLAYRMAEATDRAVRSGFSCAVPVFWIVAHGVWMVDGDRVACAPGRCAGTIGAPNIRCQRSKAQPWVAIVERAASARQVCGPAATQKSLGEWAAYGERKTGARSNLRPYRNPCAYRQRWMHRWHLFILWLCTMAKGSKTPWAPMGIPSASAARPMRHALAHSLSAYWRVLPERLRRTHRPDQCEVLQCWYGCHWACRQRTCPAGA